MKCPYIKVTHCLELCRFAEFKLLNKRVKIMIKRLFVLGLFLVASFAGFAQVSVTGVQGMRVDTLLNRYFAGGGVQISNAKFNGQEVINSNAVGVFTNGAIVSPNMPVAAGIVMVTGNCSDGGSGNYSSTESSTASPASNGDGISIALTNTLRGQGNTQSMNDVAVLTFDFIPSGEEVSFKYSFASEEYPEYVCSSFNDVFGFYISGPYDENGALDASEGVPYMYRNIAIIPGTTSPVTINTVNNGVSAGGASNCDLTNTQYFRMNANNNCKMNGYTTELETERVYVVPCKKYKLELAICDVGDGAFNSAVYLAANSFRIDEFSLSHPEAAPGVENPNRFTKGCSHYDLSMYINRPALADETHNLVFQGGDAVEGVDYELTDLNGNPAGATLTFNEGDTAATLRINFIAHDTDVPGAIKHLVILTEEVTECSNRDTLRLEIETPPEFSYTLKREQPDGWHEITDDIVYCDDVLPVNEELKVEATGGIGDLTYTWSAGNEPTEQQNTIPVANPMTVSLTIADGCGRELTDNIVFRINAATVDAAVDKENICVGELVSLSTVDAVEYRWTSVPYDEMLAANANIQAPQASPATTTDYTVEITDANACKASATVRVNVIPNVRASMRLTPTRTTLVDPNVEFQDLTVNAYSRQWDFGDGQTSTSAHGVVSYSSEDTATYQVRLIAFNQANCPDTAYGEVKVMPEFTIWIPNSFTPGSEDANSLFGPTFAYETEYELSIYSRNGNRIFVSEGDKKKWDGSIDGTDYAPEGVYVWVLMYRDGDGLLQRKTGTVNLMLNKR